MTFRTTMFAVALSALLPCHVVAQDTSSLTALPWPGAYVRLQDGDKRGQVTLTGVPNGTELRLRLDVSAPFDDDSRTAAFTDARGSVHGFAASTYIGWESWYRDHTVAAETRLRICNNHLLPPDIDPTDPAAQAARDAWCLERQRDYRLHRSPEVGIGDLDASDVEGALGGEASFSFDRMRAAPISDPGATASDQDQFDFSFGLRGAVYFNGRFAITARGGAAYERDVSLRSVELCPPTMSAAMPMTLVRACRTVQQLKSEPETSWSAYASLAFTMLVRELALEDSVPGFELNSFLENLGTDSSTFTQRIVVFMSPMVGGSTVARFGVGLDARVRLATGSDHSAGDVSWVPFIVVGATLGAGAPPIL